MFLYILHQESKYFKQKHVCLFRLLFYWFFSYKVTFRFRAKFKQKATSFQLLLQMTAEELKFALHVENVLNKLAHPEYRQLVVETVVMLSSLSSCDVNLHSTCIDVCHLLHVANDMFAHKQVQDCFCRTYFAIKYSRLIKFSIYSRDFK